MVDPSTIRIYYNPSHPFDIVKSSVEIIQETLNQIIKNFKK